MAGWGLIYKWASRIVYGAAAVLLVAFFLQTLSNVIARYVFNAPIIIGDELAFYLFVYTAVLGIYYAYSRKAHIRVDLLTSRLPERTQAWLRVVTNILEQVIWGVILWRGTLLVFDLITRTHTIHTYTLPVPIAATLIGVPIAALFIFMENVRSAVIPSIEELRRRSTPA